jgi:DNA primase
MRGTGNTSFKTNRGLLSEPFTLPAKGTCDGLALVESAIDALSYRQLHLTRIVCSIAGNGNTKLMQSALDTALKLEVPVYSAFDNDTGGNEGHERLLKLNKKNKIVRHEPIEAKDWNDYLITML